MAHKRGRPAVPVLLFLLFVSVCQFLFPAPSVQNIQSPQLPQYWELRINLHLKGNYEVKEGEKSYSGQYTFETEWIGCFEEDQDDYLMYSIDRKLIQWEAQEKLKGAEETKILETKDFPVAPELDLHYILKETDVVHFNFVVSGFNVPQAFSEYKHSLLLPATAENTKMSPDDFYSPFIVKGTNQVQLPLKNFFGERVMTSFSWSWENRKWTQKGDTAVLFDHAHDVEVEVIVVPHYKDRSRIDS
jgi:hypothetical protein